jgi:hypothetical protein
LICVFPTHVWTIILAFRDFSWIAERTRAWDAIGVLAYGLIFALVESLSVFLVFVLLGFLIPRRWSEQKRILLLGTLVLMVGLWIALSQLYFLLDLSLPDALVRALAQSEHPVRAMYVGSLALVLPAFLIPSYLIAKSGSVSKFMDELLARLALLSSIYLVFDLAAVVIIVSRNL